MQDLCGAISNMVTPFLDDSPELFVLHTRNCATEAVADTVRNIKDLGMCQYKEYVDSVITSRQVSIIKSIK